MLMAKSHN